MKAYRCSFRENDGVNAIASVTLSLECKNAEQALRFNDALRSEDDPHECGLDLVRPCAVTRRGLSFRMEGLIALLYGDVEEVVADLRHLSRFGCLDGNVAIYLPDTGTHWRVSFRKNAYRVETGRVLYQ